MKRYTIFYKLDGEEDERESVYIVPSHFELGIVLRLFLQARAFYKQHGEVLRTTEETA
jgi:hypothetical protein